MRHIIELRWRVVRALALRPKGLASERTYIRFPLSAAIFDPFRLLNVFSPKTGAQMGFEPMTLDLQTQRSNHCANQYDTLTQQKHVLHRYQQAPYWMLNFLTSQYNRL
jgi:hypothetical protein